MRKTFIPFPRRVSMVDSQSPSPPYPPQNVVCVSGDYRSGKSNYAIQLASALCLEHFSMRKLKSVYERYVDWNRVLQEEDNKAIDKMIVDTARKGNCILDFRFSALLCSLHRVPYVGVWVSASLEKRIMGNAIYWEKNEKETASILREREKEEIRICKELYDKDFRDPCLYHIFADVSSCIPPFRKPVDTTPVVLEHLDEIRRKLAKRI